MDLLLPSLFAWVLFGIGCGIAANNKGRDVASWVGLGVLLGPFGLLYIVLLSPAEKKAPLAELNTQGLAFGQMWDLILPRFCGHLGKRVTFAGEVIHEQTEE